jgi:hypothetical protein
MLTSRYSIQWVGRCRYQTEREKSDKVWGWFYYVDPTAPDSRQTYAYVFWGPTGKTLNFKRHDASLFSMTKLVRSKIDRKYQEITVDEFQSLWPDLYETVNNKFIFHLLANDI